VLKKQQLKRKKTYNLGGLLCLSATVYLIYYLLLKEKLLPFSISSTLSSNWSKDWHFLAIGLVPIYLGLMIFGTSVLSLYLGSALQRWLMNFWR
jgi:hypothetical protein